MVEVRLPVEVRRKAAALGPAGQRWIDGLGDLVAALEDEWGIRAGDPLAGGSSAYVCLATAADGSPAVLKLALPDGLEGNGDVAREVQGLLAGQGRGYVRLLHHDVGRGALLQERLGRPLDALGLSIEDQLDAIGSTLHQGWQPVPGGGAWRTGAEQARFLHGFVAATWEQLGRPCAEDVVIRAQRCASARLDAVSAGTGVVIHGDAHPANVLEDLGAPGRFKLVDPDSMVSEPAHDLAIPLRSWNDELTGSGAGDRLDGWCARLGASCDVDPGAIWEWAFTERVSTGLFLLQLGDPDGQAHLDVAEVLLAG